MNVNSIVKETHNESFCEKRLQRALKHVNDLWFPPNAKLLGRIRKGLREGDYDLSIDFLLNDIKSDFALYSYCIKEITKLLREEGVVLPSTLTPIQVLKAAGVKRLKKVINVDEKVISKHPLGILDELQANRIQEAMISASVAEALCDGQKINPELGYSTGLLRHLGLTLIAWNYPEIYRKAVESLTEEQDLDTVLSNALGFSPAMLAVSLLQEWNINEEVSNAIAGENILILSEKRKEELKHASKTLEKLCKVGEALARANDPDTYPSAPKDWEEAKGELHRALGPRGMQYIKDKVEQHLENYTKEYPELFKVTSDFNPERKIAVALDKRLISMNPYAEHCAPELKRKLRGLYSKINPNSVSKKALQELIHKVIPFAGFSGGCVYTYDGMNRTLMPRLKIGDFNEEVNLEFPLNSEKLESRERDKITYFKQEFGGSRRLGVLYLEVPTHLICDLKYDPIVHFEALRQTLQDCLNIN